MLALILALVVAAPSFTARSYREEGVRLSQDKKYEEAVAVLKKAVAASPDYGEAWVDLGNAQLSLNDYSGAARSFKSALTAKPDLSVAQYDLAFALRKSGDFDRAAEEYRVYLQRNPDDPDGTFGLAETLRGGGDANAAADAYERYAQLETRPDRVQWVAQARSIAAQLRATPANKTAERPPPGPAPSTGPKRPKVTAAAPEPTAVKKPARGEPGWKKDKDDPWSGFAGGPKSKRPAEPAVKRPFGFEVGIKALKAGQFEAAISPLEAAARALPNDALILAALAGAQLGNKDASAAEASYRSALQHATADSGGPIQFGLAEALRLEGKDADALAAYRKVLDDAHAPASLKKIATDRLTTAAR